MSEKKSARKPRRNWPKQLKRQIVDECDVPGVSVCEVARRYDLDPAQLFAWRKKLGKCAEASEPSHSEPEFVAVEIVETADTNSTEGSADQVPVDRLEIAFPNGRHLFAPIGIEGRLLDKLIASVAAA